MTNALLFKPTRSEGADDAFQRGVSALRRFKDVGPESTAISSLASLVVVGKGDGEINAIARSEDDQTWIVDLGTWLPVPAKSGCGARWLLQQYRELGPDGLARKLQGFFAILIVDFGAGAIHVITDRCGSLHVYHRQTPDGHLIATSSASLATCGVTPALDPVAVHEFVATGIVYEDRSLWTGIRKIAPATVLTIDADGVRGRSYWSFAEVEAERLGLEDAAEATYGALVSVVQALPVTRLPPVSDLTGGYDSRLLLAGLLKSGRTYETTVSGPEGHPDVEVAALIAHTLGLKHQHSVAGPSPTIDEFDAALRLTDGEYDAFDYLRILRVHRRLSVGHGMSLNGSFGELARGYWWELLWPRLAQRVPLDCAMLARRRFAAIGYDRSLFAAPADLDLATHMTDVVGRAIAPIADFPNTTQMDCAYYTLRMQRWQGRIASCTNQLWPAISPAGFGQVLDPILAAKAATRFRSLLVRRILERFAPTLARIPLEHGYPPIPANVLNLWRFAPLLGHYSGKVWSKLSARLGRQAPSAAGHTEPLAVRPEFIRLFEASELPSWLAVPKLLDSGLFRADRLAAFLDPGVPVGGRNLEQWRRLVTLEGLLRRMSAQPPRSQT